MPELTKQQARDVRCLVESGGMARDEAERTVTQAKRRIRAPKSAHEIEKWIAAQKEQN